VDDREKGAPYWLSVDSDGTQTEYEYHALMGNPPVGFTAAQIMQNAAINARKVPMFGERPTSYKKV